MGDCIIIHCSYRQTPPHCAFRGIAHSCPVQAGSASFIVTPFIPHRTAISQRGLTALPRAEVVQHRGLLFAICVLESFEPYVLTKGMQARPVVKHKRKTSPEMFRYESLRLQGFSRNWSRKQKGRPASNEGLVVVLWHYKGYYKHPQNWAGLADCMNYNWKKQK